MQFLRQAKIRDGNEVRILMDEADYIIGVYWSGEELGWLPLRWSKLTPWYNGGCESRLDLIDIIR